MNKTKDELLAEVKELSKRKPRSDKGQSHNYTRSDKTRSDKGIKRQNYSKVSPAYCKKVFNTFITANTNEKEGEGDSLIRDYNLIFPPQITNYYRKVSTSKQNEKYTYRVSQKRKNHPEELRWRWFFAEYNHAKDEATKRYWISKITSWYFIVEEDLDIWTYQEWAWSYVNSVAGHENRFISEPIIILYDNYARGIYGIANYTLEGEIIWPN